MALDYQERITLIVLAEETSDTDSTLDSSRGEPWQY